MSQRLWRETAHPYMCALCQALLTKRVRFGPVVPRQSIHSFPPQPILPLKRCRRATVPVRFSRVLVRSASRYQPPPGPARRNKTSHGSEWDNLLLPHERTTKGAAKGRQPPGPPPRRVQQPVPAPPPKPASTSKGAVPGKPTNRPAPASNPDSKKKAKQPKPKKKTKEAMKGKGVSSAKMRVMRTRRFLRALWGSLVRAWGGVLKPKPRPESAERRSLWEVVFGTSLTREKLDSRDPLTADREITGMVQMLSALEGEISALSQHVSGLKVPPPSLSEPELFHDQPAPARPSWDPSRAPHSTPTPDTPTPAAAETSKKQGSDFRPIGENIIWMKNARLAELAREFTNNPQARNLREGGGEKGGGSTTPVPQGFALKIKTSEVAVPPKVPVGEAMSRPAAPGRIRDSIVGRAPMLPPEVAARQALMRDKPAPAEAQRGRPVTPVDGLAKSAQPVADHMAEMNDEYRKPLPPPPPPRSSPARPSGGAHAPYTPNLMTGGVEKGAARTVELPRREIHLAEIEVDVWETSPEEAFSAPFTQESRISPQRVQPTSLARSNKPDTMPTGSVQSREPRFGLADDGSMPHEKAAREALIMDMDVVSGHDPAAEAESGGSSSPSTPQPAVNKPQPRIIGEILSGKKTLADVWRERQIQPHQPSPRSPLPAAPMEPSSATPVLAKQKDLPRQWSRDWQLERPGLDAAKLTHLLPEVAARQAFVGGGTTQAATVSSNQPDAEISNATTETLKSWKPSEEYQDWSEPSAELPEAWRPGHETAGAQQPAASAIEASNPPTLSPTPTPDSWDSVAWSPDAQTPVPVALTSETSKPSAQTIDPWKSAIRDPLKLDTTAAVAPAWTSEMPRPPAQTPATGGAAAQIPAGPSVALRPAAQPTCEPWQWTDPIREARAPTFEVPEAWKYTPTQGTDEQKPALQMEDRPKDTFQITEPWNSASRLPDGWNFRTNAPKEWKLPDSTTAYSRSSPTHIPDVWDHKDPSEWRPGSPAMAPGPRRSAAPPASANSMKPAQSTLSLRAKPPTSEPKASQAFQPAKLKIPASGGHDFFHPHEAVAREALMKQTAPSRPASQPWDQFASHRRDDSNRERYRPHQFADLLDGAPAVASPEWQSRGISVPRQPASSSYKQQHLVQPRPRMGGDPQQGSEYDDRSSPFGQPPPPMMSPWLVQPQFGPPPAVVGKPARASLWDGFGGSKTDQRNSAPSPATKEGAARPNMEHERYPHPAYRHQETHSYRDFASQSRYPEARWPGAAASHGQDGREPNAWISRADAKYGAPTLETNRSQDSHPTAAVVPTPVDAAEVAAPEPSEGEWAAAAHAEHGDGWQKRNRDRTQTRGSRYEGFDEEDADVSGLAAKGRKDRKGKMKRRATQTYEPDEDWEDEWEEREQRRREKKLRKEQEALEQQGAPKVPQISIPEFIAVEDLAKALSLSAVDLARALVEFGFEGLTTKSVLTGETASLIAQEYGFEVTVEEGQDRDLKPRPPPEDPSTLPARPPIVTIMGHVDHGKTTMLDYLRQSSVVSQEHGGITQHIGAFVVQMPSGKQITFLDTPGHAAFLAMRKRGAIATDIVVLVVAADDSVKPQTIEAIGHAQAAKVPLIVAINKIDKPGAQTEIVKADLAREGVEIEDFGGDVQVVYTSGKTGQGMAELEETITTLSEVLDIRAENDGMVEGWVIESSIKQVGKSAVVLVKRGTLRIGDIIVAGTSWARVRTLRNGAGEQMEAVAPGVPAEVLGWSDSLPDAGDEVIQAPDEGKAHAAIAYREEMKERVRNIDEGAKQEKRRQDEEVAKAAAKEKGGEAQADPAAEDSGPKLVNFIIKSDVAGSAEAVCGTILEIGNNEVRPNVLRSGAGAIAEWDIEHASVSGSIIVCFNIAVSTPIRNLAHKQGVRIIEHNIIYRLADEVKSLLSAHLEDKVSHRVTGEAEILQVFPINIKARVYRNIAGCRVRNGLISNGAMVRVMRKGQAVFEGKVDSLKHGKRDVGEMAKGAECGIGVADFEDYQAGDLIQTFEEVRETRHL